MNLILLIHIFCTVFMCGLCWFVQIVHYPLFKEIPEANFSTYQKKNYATGYITVPIMFIELGTGLWLLFADYSMLFVVNMVLLGVIWASTFIFQVPMHLQLEKTYRLPLVNKLIHTNWIRTLSWTARTALLGYMLFKAI